MGAFRSDTAPPQSAREPGRHSGRGAQRGMPTHAHRRNAAWQKVHGTQQGVSAGCVMSTRGPARCEAAMPHSGTHAGGCACVQRRVADTLCLRHAHLVDTLADMFLDSRPLSVVMIPPSHVWVSEGQQGRAGCGCRAWTAGGGPRLCICRRTNGDGW